MVDDGGPPDSTNQERVGTHSTRVRVRHYTKASNLSKIQESNVLLAGSQGRVFTIRARGQPPSPRDVEKTLGISRGKGNAFVDFDAVPGEFEICLNALTGVREFVFQGNVDLTSRQPQFSHNR